MRQNSEKVKHRKGKQQIKWRCQFRLYGRAEIKAKIFSKICVPILNSLWTGLPFFKPTPSSASRRGGKHHQLAVLKPFPVCFHYLTGCIPVTLHYFWLHYLPLLKSAWVGEILTALKNIKSHIYHPLKVLSFQSTLRVMRSWSLTPVKVLQQNQGGESQWPPMPAKPILLLSWCTLITVILKGLCSSTERELCLHQDEFPDQRMCLILICYA